ncbi:UNVERIFIED_CONTAM: hypothetical protein K2H54_015098 [Gekko kuhli]
MDCDAAWEWAMPSWEGLRGWGPFTVVVRIFGKDVTALLDSGSSISMVRADLVPTHLQPCQWTRIHCFARHRHQWPVFRTLLLIEGGPQLQELAAVPALPYPVLLGRDLYGFRLLLHRLTKDPKTPEVGLALQRLNFFTERRI